MVWIVDNLVRLSELFTDVATADPVSTLLFAAGAVVTLFSTGFFGYLSLRGLLAGLIPDEAGRAPPRDAR